VSPSTNTVIANLQSFNGRFAFSARTIESPKVRLIGKARRSEPFHLLAPSSGFELCNFDRANFFHDSPQRRFVCGT